RWRDRPSPDPRLGGSRPLCRPLRGRDILSRELVEARTGGSARHLHRALSPRLLTALLHPKQPVDAAVVVAESLAGLEVEAALLRQCDIDVVGHTRRAGSEHDGAGTE